MNDFNRKQKNITTSFSTIYTCPVGKKALIINSHVCNYSDLSCRFSLYWSDSESSNEAVYISNDINIPKNASYKPFEGKLVLHPNDSIKVKASENNSLYITLSIIEMDGE